VQLDDVVEPLGRAERAFEEEVGLVVLRLVLHHVLQRIDVRVVGDSFEPIDARDAQPDAGGQVRVALLRLLLQAFDLTHPLFFVVVHRGDRVGDLAVVGARLGGRLEVRHRLIPLAEIEQRHSPAALGRRPSRRIGGNLELEAQQRRDHLQVPHLPVDLTRTL